MRVLIIGSTGLISSSITHSVTARGDEVLHYNRGRADLYPNPPGGDDHPRRPHANHAPVNQ